ncbi:hypothetical protein ACFL7D_08385 [candidate division KSB1 bacterium]
MSLLSLFRKRKHLSGKVEQLRFSNNTKSSPFGDLRLDWFEYSSRAGFYRYLRDTVPIISSAVWNWVRLCNTPGKYQFLGKESHIREAEQVADELFAKMNPVIGVKRSGAGSLLEMFFREIFTVGSFSGKIIPLPSGKGIDYFEVIDSPVIVWKKRNRWHPYLKKEDSEIPLSDELFFHYGLGSDNDQPGGISFLSSIEFVTGIEQRMVSDMALSGHNAGNPHLHIKIAPPEKFENESDSKYIKRAETYFDETVKMFSSINPDDNLFTWSDIEISVTGGEGAMPYSWKINREQVIEDVITGMKLFPWVVGRSHGTTKNWVQAQYNLLMQVVDSIQEEGKTFAEWILNMELSLKNIPVKAQYVFNPNQDPYQLEKEKASALKFETVDKKVKRGYISKDDAAKELGYTKAFCSEN